MSENGEAQKKILMVDDEKAITLTVGINLKAHGYIVETVNDPRQAAEVAKEFRPDLLLLDVVMPGIDGGEVRDQIRALPGFAKIPVIMVTALVSNAEVTDDGILQSGDDVMLPKPIKLAKLLRAIELALHDEL